MFNQQKFNTQKFNSSNNTLEFKWRIKINDVSRTDFESITVLDTIAGSKKFDAIFSGSDKNKIFNHYDDIKIYGSSGDIIFRGRIEEITPDHTNNITIVSGRDYLSELLDKYVVEAYTDKLRSYIVNDIVDKNSNFLTRTNIQTSPADTELTYTFKSSVWDVLVQCAQSDGYRFWVDVDNDLHYVPKGFTDSGKTLILGTDNIYSYNIEAISKDIVNRVTIYGGGSPQVIVMLEDMDSQGYYGIIKEKRIIDDQLDTDDKANDYANAYLKENAWVLDMIEFTVDGYETLNAGELIHVTLSNNNIDDDYLVINKIHKFPDGETIIRVARYAKNLESIISNLVDRLVKVEQTFMDESAIMARIVKFYEELGLADSYSIYQVDVNDSFLCGVTDHCELGTAKLGDRKDAPILLQSGN